MDSVINPINGVSYIQLGKIIVVYIALTISGVTNIPIPVPRGMFTVTFRDNDNGNLATFWIGIDGNVTSIQVFHAVNYTSGNKYSGMFSYIAK